MFLALRDKALTLLPYTEVANHQKQGILKLPHNHNSAAIKEKLACQQHN